jgi:hypothetical protein
LLPISLLLGGVAIRSRWVSWGFLAVTGILVSAGALWIYAERTFHANFERAKADVEAGRYMVASQWLAAQYKNRRDDAELAFFWGVCEAKSGRFRAAIAA